MSLDCKQAERLRSAEELAIRARALKVLTAAKVPYLVGGAYAFCHYTGIYRDTKDVDLFLTREGAAQALDALEADGWTPEHKDEGWLFKAHLGEYFVDLIFSSGNGIATVDERWFAHAEDGVVLDQPVLLIPPEEMIWSKGFVLERERYDGADVLHIIRARGSTLDWQRMLERFGDHWEVLLSHVNLFRFTYPCERRSVPDSIMVELLRRSVTTLEEGDLPTRICRGPLLSKVNYGIDVEHWGYLNGRDWEVRAREAKEAWRERTGFEGASSSSG